MNNLRYVASASFAVAKHRHVVFLVIALLCAGMASGQTQPVYTDSMQFPWADYSYNGGSDFGNLSPVHSGANSIAYTPTTAPFNAVSFAIHFDDGDTSTAQYPVLHFWINGGANSGQQLGIALGRSDTADELETQLATGSLNTYIFGGGIGNNVWREVTVNLTQLSPPGNYAYDRLDLYSLAGDQPTVYIDDVTLTQVSAPAVNQIVFEHDIAAPVAAIATEQMNSDIITWYDAGAHVRKATLAHDTAPHAYAGTGTIYGAAMRELQYQLSDGSTRIASYTRYGNGGYGGFGYVTDHSSRTNCAGADDSPLGDFFPLRAGTNGFQRIFEGRHHAIYRMIQDYRRNCTTTTAAAYNLPVTIDWLFATGHDHPLWAITYNVDQANKAFAPNAGTIAPVGTFYDDSRAPYGEFGIDGEGFTNISGVAWGDRYKFTSDPNAQDLTIDTSWTWNSVNTVPFIKEWIKGPLTAQGHADATMGLVQTQPNAQQDAAGARDPGVGSDIRFLWNTASSVANLGCPGTNHVMPCPNDWPYQALANSLEFEPAGTANARMTWKEQYGFIGQSAYNLNDLKSGSTGTAPGYPKKSYSTYIVLGQHTTNPNPVDEQISQVETMQTVTLATATGSVVTTGPGGAGRVDTVTYQPPGYNHVYGALAFNADTNQLDATITVGAGVLRKPLIIVGNYTGADPTVNLAGVPLVADSGFFASLRPSANELWITLNSDLLGANHLEINPPSVFGAPTGVVASAVTGNQIDITWNAVAGADSYEVDRMSSLAAGFTQIATPVGNSYSDTDAAIVPNASYLYRVRAVNGGGPSANSASDLATTHFFTNADPVANASLIEAVDLDDSRTMVNYVRALADLGAFAFTDSAASNLRIKAIHMDQLRSALDEALQPLGLPNGNYTDPVLGNNVVIVKATHFQEIRDRVQ